MSTPWWASTALWVAIVEIVGGVVAGAYGGEIVGVAGWIIAVCGAIQAITRTLTTKPLSMKKTGVPRYRR
jgi:ABC-type tungstate transport system substrate-binding protein